MTSPMLILGGWVVHIEAITLLNSVSGFLADDVENAYELMLFPYY